MKDQSNLFSSDQSEKRFIPCVINVNNEFAITRSARRLQTKRFFRPHSWLRHVFVFSTTTASCHAFVSIPMVTWTKPTNFNNPIFAEHSLSQRTWRRRRQPKLDTSDSNRGDEPWQNQELLLQSRGMLPQKAKPMPIVGYNADEILEFYDKRPLEVGWRLNSLGLPLLGWYLGLLGDKLLGIQDGESVQRKRGAELRQHLVRTKSVALIKVRSRCLCLRVWESIVRSKVCTVLPHFFFVVCAPAVWSSPQPATGFDSQQDLG